MEIFFKLIYSFVFQNFKTQNYLLLNVNSGNSLAEKIDSFLTPFSKMVSDVVFFEISLFNNSVPVVVIALISMAIFLTFQLRFINIMGFRHAFHILKKSMTQKNTDPEAKKTKMKADLTGELSHWQALTTALSGTIGNGNIASVPVALILGGPGAMVWMTFAGIFGMTSKFSECFLAVKYRKTDKKGNIIGGPMYTIEHAFSNLGLSLVGRMLAVIFAVGAIGASFSLLQINQAHAQFSSVTGINIPIIFGVVFAFIVFIVVIGGAKRLGVVSTNLVPFMSLLYISATLIIILANISAIPEVIVMVFKSAFGLDAAAGGLIASLINGIQRATYSSEAGVGSSAIAHATVKTAKPVTEGFVALLEPFFDTVIICNMTALAILLSGVYGDFSHLSPSEVQGAQVTSAAFTSLIGWFDYILMISICLFALSTLISWAYYGSRAVAYIFNGSVIADVSYKIFLFFVLSTGASIKLSSIIDFTDSMLFIMAIPNMISVIILLPEIKKDLKEYNLDKE